MARTIPANAIYCPNRACPNGWHLADHTCPLDTSHGHVAAPLGLPSIIDDTAPDPMAIDRIRELMCYGDDIEPEFWKSDIAQSLFAELPESITPVSELAARWETGYLQYQGLTGWNYERWGDPELPEAIIEQVRYELDDDELVDAMAYEYRAICHSYGRPLIARTRIVWFDPTRNRVIKMATGGEGLLSNSNEVALSKEVDPWIPMAETAPYAVPGELAWSGMCIQSEMVKPVHFAHGDPTEPDWVSAVDGGQVGFNKDGKLVAYDL